MLDTDDEQVSSAVQAILDARPTFRVGNRVRVRLNAECQFQYTSGVTHFPQTDGQIGEVFEAPCECGDHQHHDDGHIYAVRFEPRVRWGDDGMTRSVLSHCFAATELERVES